MLCCQMHAVGRFFLMLCAHLHDVGEAGSRVDSTGGVPCLRVLPIGMCAVAPKQGARPCHGCCLQQLHLYTNANLSISICPVEIIQIELRCGKVSKHMSPFFCGWPDA